MNSLNIKGRKLVLGGSHNGITLISDTGKNSASWVCGELGGGELSVWRVGRWRVGCVAGWPVASWVCCELGGGELGVWRVGRWRVGWWRVGRWRVGRCRDVRLPYKPHAHTQFAINFAQYDSTGT